MKDISFKVTIHECSLKELDSREQQLVELAIEATEKSYAPYSKFNVGAAVLLKNGAEVVGANQENVAFPSGLCAERTAIFSANTQYPDQPVIALAIAARNENGLLKSPITPCGACRQVILETEHRYNHPIKVILYGTNGLYVVNSITNLLPLQFYDESIKLK